MKSFCFCLCLCVEFCNAWVLHVWLKFWYKKYAGVNAKTNPFVGATSGTHCFQCNFSKTLHSIFNSPRCLCLLNVFNMWNKTYWKSIEKRTFLAHDNNQIVYKQTRSEFLGNDCVSVLVSSHRFSLMPMSW